MPRNKPLTQQQISTVLDDCLDVEFSFLKTEQPARILARVGRAEQDFILNWVQRIASTNVQLAYNFIEQVIGALSHMQKKTIEAWALHAMDVYDQSGLYPAMEVIRNLDNFLQLSHEREHGAVFEEHAGVLMHFVHGLSGRQLKLEQGEHAYTDSETIYLPAIVARLADAQDNFRIYKTMVAYHWAQTRYGSFHIRLDEILAQQQDAQRFLELFHALDTLRLEACIARELPGLYRDLCALKQKLNEPAAGPEWQPLLDALQEPHVTVHDVLALTEQHLYQLTPPPPCFFQGRLEPEKVAQCIDQRLAREKLQLRSVLRNLVEEIKGRPLDEANPPQFEARQGKNATDEFSNDMLQDVEITLDGQPVPVPDIVKQLTTSIVQDLGEIPDEYLEPAGDGEYDPALFQDQEPDPDEVWKGSYHEEGASLYNEWDYRRQHYRKNWCAVREKDITPVYDDFVNDTLRKYSGLIKHLRKTFEAMRDEDRMLKRQVNGEGIDIDALVEAIADANDGREMSDRLFTHMHRVERNIAVVFMVDMSGSTKGWINDAERESLILLAETLETLGDRYAVYGFSGMARKRCEIYRIKDIDEPYNAEIKARISGIQPKDYTRMGFAIRHLTRKLNNIEARTRLLITISDGKPDDYDSYRGDYGIEDTRRALLEARRAGIHPYCITIDKEARDYLPHMYGPAAYTLIDEVSKLPLKVSDIYRRITT